LPVAAIWLGETLNSQAIVGGILVLTSTIIITIFDYKMSQAATKKANIQVKNENVTNL
jgi:drug/metabolite transporter (DMT)-like permease